jgi:hypothetical protein
MNSSMRNPVGDFFTSSISTPDEQLSTDLMELKYQHGDILRNVSLGLTETRLNSGTEKSGRLRNGYWYMASQYSLHPEGRNAAVSDAADVCAKLANIGVIAYSPIVLGDAMANRTNSLESSSHESWVRFNKPLMDASMGCIVLMSPNWTASRGIKDEFEYFKSIDLPVVFVEYPLSKYKLEKLKTILSQEYHSDPIAG